jgi:TadE-like protein
LVTAAGASYHRIERGSDMSYQFSSGEAQSSEGSSLIETALVMPILVLMLCFAIDVGYFFIVAANLVSSSRNAVLYSGQGFVSPAQRQLPSPGTAGSLADTAGVAGLAGGDLYGLADMTSKTSVEVCSKQIGITQTSNGYITNCSTFPSGALTFTPDQDPESANGMLAQRVDVVYTVSPPIPVDFFTFTMPALTVHWQAEMRAID